MTKDTFNRIYMYHMPEEFIDKKVGKLVWGMGMARTLTLEAEIDLDNPDMSFLTHSCILSGLSRSISANKVNKNG